MKNVITKAVVLTAALLVFLSSGCKTNPPVAPQEPVFHFGKILVTANIEGARIYLDDQNTGKITPDTVQALVGKRKIKLVKDGYSDISIPVEVSEDQLSQMNIWMPQGSVLKEVLLEDFANVSCIPCVTSNKITHSLSGYYQGKIHLVKFHTNFPKATDPFYLAARTDCNARMSFYEIVTAPTIIVDGTRKPVPSDSIDIKNAIDISLAEEPLFDISVTDTIYGGSIYVKVKIIPVNTTEINIADYVLNTAVVEKRIETATPPGSNGETVFYDVLRKMLTFSNGPALLETNLIQPVEYEYQEPLGSAWNTNELSTIVYIQNKNTKKVLQAASAE